MVVQLNALTESFTMVHTFARLMTVPLHLLFVICVPMDAILLFLVQILTNGIVQTTLTTTLHVLEHMQQLQNIDAMTKLAAFVVI
jgi:hypothetical protein